MKKKETTFEVSYRTRFGWHKWFNEGSIWVSHLGVHVEGAMWGLLGTTSKSRLFFIIGLGSDVVIKEA